MKEKPRVILNVIKNIDKFKQKENEEISGVDR